MCLRGMVALLTAAFVHVGILHLATNMWCLWNLGLLGEPLLGPAGVVAVYVLTGVAGNLLSTAVHPQIVGAGASGAVFGLAGVLILLLKAKLLPVPPGEIRRLRKSVIYFALAELCDRGHYDVPENQHPDRQHGPPGRISLRSGSGSTSGTQNRRGQEPIRLSLLGCLWQHVRPAAVFAFGIASFWR